MPSRRQAPRLLPVILFVAIVAAASAASVVALNARGPQLELRVTKLPHGSQHRRVTLTPAHPGQIRLSVAESDPAARVSIIGPEQRTVRTLAASIALPAGRSVAFAWDGRTNAGRPAPPGSYHLRVQLPSRDRDMVWPIRIELAR